MRTWLKNKAIYESDFAEIEKTEIEQDRSWIKKVEKRKEDERGKGVERGSKEVKRGSKKQAEYCKIANCRKSSKL